MLSQDTNTNTTPLCDTKHTRAISVIAHLQQTILSSEKSQRMAEFFGLLADSNRLRILSLLAQEEMCVCDIAASLGMSESAVSHQLRTLKAIRLVNYRKQGRKVFYKLLDNHVFELYQAVAHHMDEV